MRPPLYKDLSMTGPQVAVLTSCLLSLRDRFHCNSKCCLGMVVMVICSTLDLISVQPPISSGCGTSHNSVTLLTGADDILPYLIFTLVRTAPKHIHSNIRLVDNEMCYCVCVCGCGGWGWGCDYVLLCGSASI